MFRLCRRFVSVYQSPEILAKYGKSPLFVIGDKQSIESFIIPDDIIDKDFSIPAMEANLKARRMPSVDLAKMKNGFEFIKYIAAEHVRLEQERERIRSELRAAANGSNPDIPLEATKEKKIKNKEELRVLLDNKVTIQEEQILPSLRLPNDIHSSTPLDEDRVRSSYGNKPSFAFAVQDHLTLAKDDLTLTENGCYLFGRLAQLEFDLGQTAKNKLLALDNFTPFIGSDLIKSLVVEGCGDDFLDPDQVLTLKETTYFGETGQSMNLVGGASIYSFVAFFIKNVVSNANGLPKTFFTVGKRYKPVVPDQDRSLWNMRQSSAVYCFNIGQATRHPQKLTQAFEKQVEIVTDLYKKIGLHFRKVSVAAFNLHPSEGARVSFQMWSPSKNDYIEVGHVSLYGDYLSKRLMLKAMYKVDKYINLEVIAGEVMNLHKVIGIAVETTQQASGQYTL